MVYFRIMTSCLFYALLDTKYDPWQNRLQRKQSKMYCIFSYSLGFSHFSVTILCSLYLEINGINRWMSLMNAGSGQIIQFIIHLFYWCLKHSNTIKLLCCEILFDHNLDFHPQCEGAHRDLWLCFEMLSHQKYTFGENRPIMWMVRQSHCVFQVLVIALVLDKGARTH